MSSYVFGYRGGSMAATDVKPSRLEWAKEEALKIIDAAEESHQGMVLVFNSTASTW